MRTPNLQRLIDKKPISGKVYSLQEMPLSTNWYYAINCLLNVKINQMDARMMHCYAMRAETEMDALRVPTGNRGGCTYDITEACLYPGQEPTRVVLRRVPGIAGKPSWRIMYYGTVAGSHRSEEVGILRLTLAAEEATHRAGRKRNRPSTNPRTGVVTPRKLRLVKAA